MAIALEIYEALRSVGVEDAKAKSTAEKFDQAVEARFEREHRVLATREDVAGLRSSAREDLASVRGEIASIREQMATREDLANVRGEMAALRGEMREELNAIRAEMSRLEARLIKWNVGTIIAVAGLTLAIVKLVG